MQGVTEGLLSSLREPLLTLLECSQAGHNARCNPAHLDLASVRNGASRELEARSGKVSGVQAGPEGRRPVSGTREAQPE